MAVLTPEMRGRKMEVDQGPWGLEPEPKGRATPKQKVRVLGWYLKRKDAAAWKKKKRMSKSAKRARKRNRGR